MTQSVDSEIFQVIGNGPFTNSNSKKLFLTLSVKDRRDSFQSEFRMNNFTSSTNTSLEEEEDFKISTPDVDLVLLVFLIMYGVIFVVGSLSNLLVICSLLRRPKMGSVTNNYILNLAISDFFFLSSIPFLIDIAANKTWRFGTIMCKVYFGTTCLNWYNGVFTLTALSVDRYLAVCRAVDSAPFRSNRNARIVCLCTWCLSALVMMPIFLYSREVRSSVSGRSCTIQLPAMSATASISSYQMFIYSAFCLGFVLPMACVCVSYALVVRRMNRLGPRTAGRKRSERKNKRRMTLMVSSLIGVYCSCWTPYWMFQIISLNLTQLTESHRMFFQFLTILTYANSTLNPILYAFLNHNFKLSLCMLDQGRRSTISETINNGRFRNQTCKSRKPELEGSLGR